MIKSKYFALYSLVILCLNSCASNENENEMTLNKHLIKMQDSQNTQTEIRDYSLYSPRIHHKSLNDYAQQMLLDFELNSNAFYKPIAITSFVEFDNRLTSTNSLGNQFAEALAIEMVKEGYPIAELNSSGMVLINEEGNFILTRLTQVIADDELCCALSGNMIYQTNGVRINSKLFDIKTQKIISATSLVIPYFVIENYGIAVNR
jgi:TolB-like protein